jgi:hypothetical protein
MNWMILIPLAIAVIILIIFLIRRNLKDQEDFELYLKNNYRKEKDHEGDIETEDSTR